MPLDKTLTDVYRRELDLDKYDVLEALPGFFDERYPELIKFLQAYYESLEEEDNPAESLNDLLTSRDVAQAKEELLSFLASELLLGKSYFESFDDKRTALQFSNLLYRSKGTAWSIQQFFRIFYGVEVNITYGKDEVFFIGEPAEEIMVFTSEGESTGSNFRYTYFDADVIVSVKNTAGDDIVLRIDVDYELDFSSRTVRLLKGQDLEELFDDTGQSQKNDANLIFLSNNGFIQAGQDLTIRTIRRRSSTIGADVQDKRILNDKFFQLYGILLTTPLSTNIWRDAYKTFIHPGGVYFGGQVQVVSTVDLNFGGQDSIIEPPPPVVVVSTANVLGGPKGKVGLGNPNTWIGDVSADSDGNLQISRINDMINLNQYTIGEWDKQFQNIARADDISSRTLDGDSDGATLDGVINRIDEDILYRGPDDDIFGRDSDLSTYPLDLT